MHRQIAGKLTGPVTKWIVLGVVVLLTVVHRARLGAKLADVKNNEASSWLPASRRVDPGRRRAVRHRRPQRHPDARRLPPRRRAHRRRPRRHRRAGDRDRPDRRRHRRRACSPPTAPRRCRPRRHGHAAAPRTARSPTLLHLQLRQGRLEQHPRAADEIRDITEIDGVDVHVGGFGGQAADSTEAFEGSHGTLLLITFGVVILILLFTYRSPVLWILPILCAVVAYIDRRRRGLPARQVRRPHGQRPEPRHPRHPGDRRRHRLRAAAGRPLSRRAPSPRGPARGDGVRAAPRRAGHPRQRRDRRRRHALPVLRRPQLHRRPRPGPRRRRRRHPAGHGRPCCRRCW